MCGAGGAPVYTVRVPNSAGVNQQVALAGLYLSGALQDATSGGSLRDSNGQPSAQGAGAPAAVAPVACAALAVPGADDHTIDFGFHPPLPPTAVPQALATDEDTQLAINLTGTDPDGLPLSFNIVGGPANGVLAGSPPNVTYTPSTNFSGQDSFTFKASDGQFDSPPAAVTITIRPVNDPPTVPSADPGGTQVITTEEDTPVAFVVAASDVDGDPLTFTLVTPPAHGSLSGTLPAVTYQPDANFNGQDGFNFAVSDAAAQATGTVRIEVLPVNDPPTVPSADPRGAQIVTTEEETPVTFTVSAGDVDGDPLTFTMVASTTHGALGGALPGVVYTPYSNFDGPDSFVFAVSDGLAQVTGTVFIEVLPVNDAPLAASQFATATDEAPLTITLNAVDVEGDPLTYTVVSNPQHGNLSAIASQQVTYTASGGPDVDDQFTFRANDGRADSNIATISIHINRTTGEPEEPEPAILDRRLFLPAITGDP
ncbi:MAG: Ig-like domain-containing protein [Caldilineaceae bacterium]